MTQVQWKDLSTEKRTAIGVLGAIQVALLVAAQIDIQRRPATMIKGAKSVWRLVSFINFIGPLTYFRWGRVP